jgi:hypothetical protein
MPPAASPAPAFWYSGMACSAGTDSGSEVVLLKLDSMQHIGVRCCSVPVITAAAHRGAALYAELMSRLCQLVGQQSCAAAAALSALSFFAATALCPLPQDGAGAGAGYGR